MLRARAIPSTPPPDRKETLERDEDSDNEEIVRFVFVGDVLPSSSLVSCVCDIACKLSAVSRDGNRVKPDDRNLDDDRRDSWHYFR